MPVQPEYQSRPSSRIGRQACAAIETRIASVTSMPCAPENSFSARKSNTRLFSFSLAGRNVRPRVAAFQRSEEHTSELQSRLHLVCRLLLEKKKKIRTEEQTSHRGDASLCSMSSPASCISRNSAW